MTKYDLLIMHGYLVDAASGCEGGYDVGICDGKVADVAEEINPDHAADVFDADGKLVFPGLVDTHVHLTHTRQPVGLQMLARAGHLCFRVWWLCRKRHKRHERRRIRDQYCGTESA